MEKAMRPYHPANLQYLPHAKWRVIALAWVAKFLGLHFHIEGIPFGTAYRGKVGPNPLYGQAVGNMEKPQ